MNIRRTCAFCLAVGLASAAQATTVTYNDFSNITGLTTVGSVTTPTTADGTVLRLTPAGSSQAGAAYSTSPISLGISDTFSTRFQFRFTDAGGVDPADGITFVLAKNVNGLGGNGVGMGYSGVGNSIAIEFDTYNNNCGAGGLGCFAAEPNSSNHVAIDTDGHLTNTAAANVYNIASCGFPGGVPSQSDHTAAGCMSNGDLWTANINYDGSTQLLNVSLFDPTEGTTFDAITNQSLDVGSYLGTSSAFVGFTASTGAGWENHDIVNWEFADTATLPAPVSTPEPSGLALFAGALIGLAFLRRRRLV